MIGSIQSIPGSKLNRISLHSLAIHIFHAIYQAGGVDQRLYLVRCTIRYLFRGCPISIEMNYVTFDSIVRKTSGFFSDLSSNVTR